MPDEKNAHAEPDNGAAGMRQQLKVPFRTVVVIAVNGIRIRFWRSMVTAAGIFLGIAFLSYVTTNIITAGTVSSEHYYQSIWLGVMSLLVSFVGIMNSMLMSVTERFREIGTMKCLGAPDDFVVSLFFVEATLTGIIASAVGWLLGFSMSIVQKVLGGGSPHLTFGTVVLLALGCTIGGGLMTLIATILPANQAARMPAAAALRTEI
jgi:cell division protein FtsX